MTADTVGGVWTYSLELSRSLISQGFTVALATMGRALFADQRREAEITGLELFESDYKLEWMPDAWEDVAAAGEWLLGISESWHPNFVHVNGYAHANLRWRRPVVLVAHSCVTSWWKAVHNSPPPPGWNRYRSVVRLGLKAADIVVAPSHAMLETLSENYWPLQNGRVVYNGLADPYNRDLPSKDPIIFVAGRIWDKAKNIELLARCAGSVRWPVYVAGETELNGSSGTFGNMHLLGRLPSHEVRNWLARASICALPARYEPFGLLALEAAQAGCALVLGDIPSLREIWREAAVYVRPDDPAQLVSVLNDLAASPQRVREFGELARAAAKAYSSARMCEGYINVYREAALSWFVRMMPDIGLSSQQNDGPVPIKREGVPCAS